MKTNPTSLRLLNDEQLMAEVIRHHAPAEVSELHRRYSKRLLGFFIKMLGGDVETAQDLVQEIFLRLLEKKHLYDPSRSFYTWLFTIASNLCKTHWRHAPFQTLTEAHSSHQKQMAENLADKAFFMESIKSGLAQLEHHQRTAFVLRYMEQFSLNEIADIMECSLGTVKSRLFYATQKMTLLLKDFDPSSESTYFKLH